MPRSASSVLLSLIAILSFLPGVAGAADEAETRAGYVILQIDGLSEPALRAALDAGAMPFTRGLIADGSHVLGRWWTTSATTTTVTQAGLLHGTWRGIPGFRWWDRQTGRLIDFLDRAQARRFADGLSGPDDLLADGGASITNLFSGGAPRVVLTATMFDGAALAWQLLRYVADLPKDVAVAAGLAEGIRAALARTLRGDAARFQLPAVKRKAPVPIVGPALEWALVDVTAAAVVRELERETPLMYATFTTYDEVAHYAGVRHPAAFEALGHIDAALQFIDRVAARSARPYHLIVLSDHGQTEGQPFALRWGRSLDDVVRGLLVGAGDVAHEPGLPDVVVAASGNLAHIYFPPAGRRLDAAEVEALHPGLTAGLLAHPGIGIVALQTETGEFVAMGAGGTRQLGDGSADGSDPLEGYGPLAAISLANITASPNAGDLVAVAAYDPLTEETFSFEPQRGSHGGIGGPQAEPFLLYPRALEPSGTPLSPVGVDELRAAFDGWLASSQQPLPPTPSSVPHVGEEVCVSSEVEGATGRVCARRVGFGADWDAELTDTLDDGRPVKATISLEVAESTDESASVQSGDGAGGTVHADGAFRPRVGASLGKVAIETCVVVRFLPDDCTSSSAPLPQLSPLGTADQLERLEELVFDVPLDSFMAVRGRTERTGVDAGFDWSSDGCSAGPLRELFDDRLEAACLRHDFAYRNYGQLSLDPTDEVRGRVDEQLATDATAVGQGILATGLRDTLRRFGAPVFFGDDLATLWDVPDFIVDRLLADKEEATAGGESSP